MLCPRVVFPSRKAFVEEFLLNLVEETMNTYVVHALVDYLLATCTFDLLMSNGMHDIFIVVINLISSDWKAKHVTIRLFEVTNTSGITMVSKFQELINKFSLITKILAYVKDKGSNLQACANAPTSIVSCDFLALLKSFDGSHLGHALSKVCQYVIIDEKVVVDLSFASIKVVQSTILKHIIWTKKSNKGKQSWEKACIEFGLKPMILNTPTKTRYKF